MQTFDEATSGEVGTFQYKRPPFGIQFLNTEAEGSGKEVGRFFIKDGQLAFEGDAHESAKIFLRELGQQWLEAVEKRKAEV